MQPVILMDDYKMLEEIAYYIKVLSNKKCPSLCTTKVLAQLGPKHSKMEMIKPETTSLIAHNYYPKLGRMLTSSDIGKEIVRAREHLFNGCSDWSYVPNDASNTNHHSRLGNIDADGYLYVQPFCSETLFRSEISNDGYWITLDEFIAHVNSPDAEIAVMGRAKPLIRGKAPRVPSTLLHHKIGVPSPKVIPTQWVDHAYYPPESIEIEHAECEPPDFSSNDPYAILGLAKGEPSQEVIRTRFKELARIYHPDKGVEDRSLFQKITQAYKTLSFSISSFVVNPEDSLESILKEALDFWQSLKLDTVIFSLKEINALLPIIQDFMNQLNSVDKGFEDALCAVNFIRIKERAKCILSYYQTKQTVLSLRQPDAHASKEEKERYIEETLSILSCINFGHLPWNPSNLILFTSAQDAVLDKYLSILRSSVEMDGGSRKAVAKEQFAPMLQIVLQERLTVCRAATQREALFNKKTTTPLHEESSLPFLSHNQKDQSKVDKIPSDALSFCKKEQKNPTQTFNLKKEILALKANIKKNSTFFEDL